MKKKLLILLLAMNLGLTACASAIPQKETSTAPSQTETSELKESSILDQLIVEKDRTYGKLSENLTIDVTNEDLYKEVGEHAIVPVKMKSVDDKYLADRFFNKKIEPSEVLNQDGELYTLYEEGDKSMAHSVDESGLYENVFGFSDFWSQTVNVFHYKMLQPKDLIWDTTRYFEKDKDLSFAKVLEVKEEVVKALEESGYNFKEFPLYHEEVFALTKEKLKEAEDFLIKKDCMTDLRTGKSMVKGKWTTDDEAYYLYLHTAYDGVPLYEESASERLKVLYNKDKIQSIEIINPLEVIPSNLEKKPLISLEEALKSLIAYDKNILDGKEHKVSDMKLCYYLNRNNDGMTLIPVWYVEYGIVYGDDQPTNANNLFLNAITGEWFMEEIS
ncbi:hypothetical protein P261_01431 [Lachnospiraceae bacterium TWA4]|nr:hypothetical protein P261_01431 [Lachnospiraceae bacterium TWA4]